eukprot:80533_1
MAKMFIWFILIFIGVFSIKDSLVPSIDDLSAEWNEAVPLRGIGPAQNFIGSVGIRGSPYQGTRRSDLISMSQLIFSPFDGNMINSTMKLITNNNNTITSIPLLMNETKWSACDVARRTSFFNYPSENNNMKLRFTNNVRLSFEKRLVMSRYVIETNDTNKSENISLNIEFNLTGPIFQRCGVNLTDNTGKTCGWGVWLPTDRSDFIWNINTINDTNVGVIQNKYDKSIESLITVYAYDANNKTKKIKLNVEQNALGNTIIGNINNITANDVLLVVFSVGDINNDKPEDIIPISNYGVFIKEWNNACDLWENRWQKAFVVNNDHFSGNLPVLDIDNNEIKRLYYVGLLSLISLERVNLNISNRTYTISQGNPSQLNAQSSMGGSGQFTWDLSFTSNVLTLLDPLSTKDVLRFMVSNTLFFDNKTKPFLVPQLWDCYSLYSYPQTTPYMFDYMTAYQFISTYVRITNDTNFLNEEILLTNPTNELKYITVKNYLIKLATSYEKYPSIDGSNGYITNYGGNIRCFLEVIPTYIYAIPALNYGNAYMLMSVSQLLNDSNNDTIIKMRETAINIIEMSNKLMYNKDGTFNCLYPNNTKQNVRTIADYVYISQQLGLFIPREGGDINNQTLKNEINNILYEMNNFAMNELYVNKSNWFRALSLNDSIYHPNNLLIMRADWGIGGSYPGLDGMIIESLSIGDKNYNRAIKIYEECELVTHKGSMSQGIAVYTPNVWLNGTQAAIDYNYNMYRQPPNPPYQPAWPEYFENGDFWPETLRDIANVAASFPEAMIRTLFGFNPTWYSWNDNNNIINSFMNINRSRPFNASLIGLKIPNAYVNVYVDQNGIHMQK